MSRLAIFAPLLLAVACTPPADPLAERIARVEALVRGDTCFQQTPSGQGCEWSEVTFDPGRYRIADGSEETILVIDSFLDDRLPLFALRYQNRLKAYVRAAGDGTLEEVTPRWRVPARLHAALAELSDPEFIAARRLRSLYPLIDRTYGEAAAELSIGHGAVVLGIILESNPHHGVVVMDYPDLFDFALDPFCAPDLSDPALADLQARIQRVADGLRSMITTHNVRFVNASNGVTLETMRSVWDNFCPGERPDDAALRRKLSAFAPYHDVLFNTPGVFTAHAAYPAGAPQDYPYDYPSAAYPNRLRFAYFSSLESGLDPEGRGDSTRLEGWPEARNVDVFLNGGVLPGRPALYNQTALLSLDPYGLDALPIVRSTTSWLTPLGLSRFIHLRESTAAGEPMSNALIATLMERLSPQLCPDQQEGRCRFQDPLLHGQIESIRLGYRPREFEAEPEAVSDVATKRLASTWSSARPRGGEPHP